MTTERSQKWGWSSLLDGKYINVCNLQLLALYFSFNSDGFWVRTPHFFSLFLLETTEHLVNNESCEQDVLTLFLKTWGSKMFGRSISTAYQQRTKKFLLTLLTNKYEVLKLLHFSGPPWLYVESCSKLSASSGRVVQWIRAPSALKSLCCPFIILRHSCKTNYIWNIITSGILRIIMRNA